jgi:chromosome segregation ATPase
MEATGQETSSAMRCEFKSPFRLLLQFFRRSRDQWKNKAIERRAKLRNLEDKVRDIDRSRAGWKSKAQQFGATQKAFEERLRVLEEERAQLLAKIEELESKKARRPVVR